MKKKRNMTTAQKKIIIEPLLVFISNFRWIWIATMGVEVTKNKAFTYKCLQIKKNEI